MCICKGHPLRDEVIEVGGLDAAFGVQGADGIYSHIVAENENYVGMGVLGSLGCR